ncbi:MAG: proteasome-activating nucleotidase, partial [Candidatus Thermoplasmatota archaeon]|nr:proteasome-activating nucleotidase [Candidatus Thermoplasmatota archaeon]
NRKDIIDEALMRPGRFDRIIEVPIPNKDGRKKILSIHTRGMKMARNIDLETLSERTEDFSGADLRNLCTEAGMFAIRRGHSSVRKDDLDSALNKTRRRKEQRSRDPDRMFH